MDGTAARFGAIMGALWAAHDVADHVVQTDTQARRKGQDDRWAAAMAGHVGGYTAVQLGALVALSRGAGMPLTWRRTLLGVAFSAISHAFLDRRWPVRRALELTGSPGFASAATAERELPVGRASWAANSDSWADTMSMRVPPTPIPLHGPYLADQALHHGCLAVTAAIIAGGVR